MNNKKPIRFAAILVGIVLTISCRSNSGGSEQFAELAAVPAYNFSAADSRMQAFVEENQVFDGISYTVVDAQQGTVHEGAFGDHDPGIVVMLASTSKVPATLLLMALHDDPAIDFDINEPIASYLPWMGVYGDASTAQLLSNTSGIEGLSGIANYGAHICQYVASADMQSCGEAIYTNELPNSVDPGTRFSYGGSQWQLAGVVAEVVGGASWAQLFDQYLAGPCDLEVFRFGNPWSDLSLWNGSPDSLVGLDNPNIEGGAISNMRDYAKLLSMILNDGMCGSQQVLTADSLAFMRIDRGGELGTAYGMGWWIQQPEDGSTATLFYDPGAFGAMSWIDTARGYGGYLAVDDYTRVDSGAPVVLAFAEIIPALEQAIDAARAEAESG